MNNNLRQAHLAYCMNVGMTEKEAEEDWKLIQKDREDFLDELIDPKVRKSFLEKEKMQKARFEKEKTRLDLVRRAR